MSTREEEALRLQVDSLRIEKEQLEVGNELFPEQHAEQQIDKKAKCSSVIAEKDKLIAEKDSLVESLLAEKDCLIAEKDSLIAEKDSLASDATQLKVENEGLVTQIGQLKALYDQLLSESISQDQQEKDIFFKKDLSSSKESQELSFLVELEKERQKWEAREQKWEAREQKWEAREQKWEAREKKWEARERNWEAREKKWEAREQWLLQQLERAQGSWMKPSNDPVVWSPARTTVTSSASGIASANVFATPLTKNQSSPLQFGIGSSRNLNFDSSLMLGLRSEGQKLLTSGNGQTAPPFNFHSSQSSILSSTPSTVPPTFNFGDSQKKRLQGINSSSSNLAASQSLFSSVPAPFPSTTTASKSDLKKRVFKKSTRRIKT